MKKPLFITLILISLIIVIYIMNRFLFSAATAVAISTAIPQTTQAQTSSTSTTPPAETIKHELARMPEQASWTIERWNINDVDFELKEVSKATRNQPAKFELKVEIPSKNKKKEVQLNPVSQLLGLNKITEITTSKNKVLYKSYLDFLNEAITHINDEYWHIFDYQIKKIPRQDKARLVNKSELFYQSYMKTDFSKVNWLISDDFFLGEAIIAGHKYLIYGIEFNSQYRDTLFKHAEHAFNLSRAGDGYGNIDQEKLAKLPTINKLFTDKFSYTAIIDKDTQLPIYYSDCISVRKYNLDQEYQAFDVPEIIQKNVKWYIDNVLPTKTSPSE